jgi:hypothetical protein
MRINRETIRILFSSTAIIASVLLSGCTEKPAAPRNSKANSPGSTDGRTEWEKEKSKPKSGDIEKDARDKDEVGLEPYLLTRANVEDLLQQPFLDKIDMPDELSRPKNKMVAGGESMQSFLSGIMQDMLTVEELNADRKVKLTVTDDDEPNASMDAWYQAIVKTGMFAPGTDDSLLAVLCHELAHGARNHGYYLYFPDEDLQPATVAVSEFLDETGEYIDDTYKDDTYIHDRDRYEDLWKRWKKLHAGYSAESKLSESEADVVGAHICSHLGLSPEKFGKSLYDAFTSMDDGSRGISKFDLPDGEEVTIEDSNPTDMFNMLFPTDSHPTADERHEQLKRLADHIRAKDPAKPGLIKTWRKDYPPLRKQFSGSGLTLTDQAGQYRVIGYRADGTPIKIRQTGCSHQYHFRPGP